MSTTAGRRVAERPPSRWRRPRVRLPDRTWLVLWAVLLVAGGTALGLAAAGIGPGWLAGVGAVGVVSALAWALAVRVNGRPGVVALLALGLGAVCLAVDTPVLRTGAAVLTTVVAGALAVMVTVPARSYPQAVREVLVATLVAAVGAVAALGFEPTASAGRFEFVSLVLAVALVLGLVHRLGAGLHGLGRRGLLAVLVGVAVLLVSLGYGELLRRYGVESVVQSVLDFVSWTRARIGAFPRPLVVLLGVPALVWGTHLRARRRQGWWVCAFGVTATVAVAHGLVNPATSYAEAGLQVVYGVLLGLVVGYLVVRADLALTGPRGRRARRLEEAAAVRPEPSRFAPL